MEMCNDSPENKSIMLGMCFLYAGQQLLEPVPDPQK
jgi:hypothetical protein